MDWNSILKALGLRNEEVQPGMPVAAQPVQQPVAAQPVQPPGDNPLRTMLGPTSAIGAQTAAGIAALDRQEEAASRGLAPPTPIIGAQQPQPMGTDYGGAKGGPASDIARRKTEEIARKMQQGPTPEQLQRLRQQPVQPAVR